MAAVSCGAMTIALAPCESSVWTLEISLVTSLAELVCFNEVMPSSLASIGV